MERDVVSVNTKVVIHPLTVRITHWVNVLAIFIMIGSGWRIYDASPLFADFKFPPNITVGGWLGGALQWHFAAMWVLGVNALVYLSYGVLSGHFRKSFLPIRLKAIVADLMSALHGHLPHELGVYNAVQRLAYVGVIVVVAVIVISGLAIWKPVQFQEIGALMGGYEGARRVHFFGMWALVAFVAVHVVMVVVVPRTFLPMWSGWTRVKVSSDQHRGIRR